MVTTDPFLLFLLIPDTSSCQYFEDIRISFITPWLCVSGPAPRMSESGRIDIEMGQSVMQHPGFVKIIYETRKEDTDEKQVR